MKNLNSETEYEDNIISSEFISLRVSQSTLLNYNITLNDYMLISEIYKIEKNAQTKDIPSAKYFSSKFPAIFKSRRNIDRILLNLIEAQLLKKVPHKFSSGNITSKYVLTKKGKDIAANALYILNYTKEEYIRAIQVIDYWNTKKCFSTHKIKPYGETQTKNIHDSIHMINDLISEKSDDWRKEFHSDPFSLNELYTIIDKYEQRFSPDYYPANKNTLPKAFSSFIMDNRGFSQFEDIIKNGNKELVRTIDELKEIISAPILKKAYEVLSETGKAKEEEKLEIQKSLLRTHKQWKRYRDTLLDDLYDFKKQYVARMKDFNVFMYEVLFYISGNVEKGKAKPGFISFREGNKIMEGFSKYFIDKYNIYLWPSKRQEENIRKMKKID
jgi:hypothetical protein